MHPLGSEAGYKPAPAKRSEHNPEGGTCRVLALARLWNWLKSEKGQGLAEYGLIIVLVALVAAAAITAFGGQISQLFGRITSQLSSP